MPFLLCFGEKMLENNTEMFFIILKEIEDFIRIFKYKTRYEEKFFGGSMDEE